MNATPGAGKTGVAVDDYLDDLLGGPPAAAAAAPPAPPPALAPEPAPAPAPAPAAAAKAGMPGGDYVPKPGDITEDEFDALLDQLHGSGAPGHAPAAPAPAPAAAPKAGMPGGDYVPKPGDITEDEFDALLDQLHGSGAPGQAAPAPAPAPKAGMPGGDYVPKPGDITEDEFDALLDQLHGSGAPGQAAPAPAPAPKAGMPGGDYVPKPGDITEDEFDALLDQLHGMGAPGAGPAPPAPPPAPPPPAPPPPARPPGPVQHAPAPPSFVAPVARARRADDDHDDEAPLGRRGDAPERDYWLGHDRRATGRTARWLRLRVHAQDYAVELLKVQEVLLPPPVLAVRGAPPSVLGAMNLRGIVVPVVDLGLWLGTDAIQETPEMRLVVLEEGGDAVAVRVTSVLDVHTVAEATIEPPEHTLAGGEPGTVRGITRIAGQPVILMNASKLLG